MIPNICIFSLYIFFPNIFMFVQCVELPRLLVDFPKEWERISLADAVDNAYYRDWDFFAGDNLKLKCDAPYPIQWNITGFFSRVDDVKIYQTSFSPEEKLYHNQMHMDFSKLSDSLRNVAISIKVACQMIGNSEISNAVRLFTKSADENPTLYAPSGMKSGKLVVTESTLLPCITTNPLTPVYLYQVTDRGKQLATNNYTTYSPTEGFRSKKVFRGEYECSQDGMVTSLVSITALAAISEDEYQFSPLLDFVDAVWDETVDLECYSKSGKPTEIVVSNEHNKPELNVLYKTINHRSIAQLKINISNLAYNDRIETIEPRVSYTAICISNSTNGGHQIQIKNWTINILTALQFRFDNRKQKLECHTSGVIILRNHGCGNGMECNFVMSQCKTYLMPCMYRKTTSSMIIHDNDYASEPYSYMSGVVIYAVQEFGSDKSHIRAIEYFTSLDYIKYTNWKNAEKRELIRLDEVDSVLYTNNTNQFFCSAVAYLFREELTFVLEFKNGTRANLNNNNNTIKIPNDPDDRRKIDDFITIGILEIMLPLDATQVYCLAHWWNSTDVMKTSTHFETKHLLTPKFMDGEDDLLVQESLFVGDKNWRLTCLVNGEPQPFYHWYFNNINALEVFPELKTSVGLLRGSHLEFPEIMDISGKKYSGEYKCLATNRVGNVSRQFHVTVKDKVIETTSIIQGPAIEVYINVGLAVALSFGFILTALFIYMRRYKKAQETMRSLNDAEVEEFFEGRSELAGKGDNIEMVEFLPFDKKYEIPKADLEFELTKSTMLGSGEFAFVVRGLIISKGIQVALKIAKPSTNLVLFKSMLYEVKIMAYIGTHKNVLSLIGVCTDDIQNRSIFIATQICELGSLNSFLRKARPSFVNLVNENQQVDTNLQHENLSDTTDQPITTTLDLISFCLQIAQGMEYLANKLVIHADLATRNVLLTVEKVAKISDFGLSKRLYESSNYVRKSKTPLPWRWMAIESLKTRTFSVSSDVWAYGVTLFEIFTLGDAPFPNDTWNTEFVARLEDGMRMARPKYSTQEIYSKLVTCWEQEPELRPSFTSLRMFFEELYHRCTNEVKGDQYASCEPPTEMTS